MQLLLMLVKSHPECKKICAKQILKVNSESKSGKDTGKMCIGF